jgi:hypothetical protein
LVAISTATFNAFSACDEKSVGTRMRFIGCILGLIKISYMKIQKNNVLR